MRKSVLFLIILFSSVFLFSQNKNPEYDSTYAKTMGADSYGMKMYVLVILKTGTNTLSDKAQLDSLFKGHLNNINRLADLGKLVVAGPLEKNENSYRGIFILNVSDIEEAKKLLETDPAIKANIFAADLYNWYGSAALPEHLKFHKKLEKSKF